MTTVHATPIDLANEPWNLRLDSTTASRLLTRAAAIVHNLTLTAVYATGPDGTPTDPAVAAALRNATCAQAAWFDETGDTGSGASAIYATVALGSARLSAGGGGSATNTTAADSRYSPEAVQILANTGLLTRQVQSW